MTTTGHPEPRFYEQTWDLSYRHALGETTSRFLAGLAEGRVQGRRCPVCARVLVPARSFCDRDHVATEEWVDVANEGVVEMFTVVYEPFRNLPEPPYALAYVTLRGASTALVGYVRGLDLSDQAEAVRALAVGTPVVVRFAEEPTGTAADYWFEPAGTTEPAAGRD
ncbi:OB-fold domain-containing protein [Streptomyces sp. NPDC005438]|uniref:Zn-ribbon domain-containing OB-fold protein n=1 Tax=Streptomyces sp. NPDC005438 TaxID=3156880 RepID=UPI0033A40A05